MIDALDPGIEWWDRDDDPEPTVHRGHDAIRAQMSGIRDAWTEFHVVPQEFIETDDSVVAPIEALARGRTSGLELIASEVHVLRGGKVVELREGRERLEALRAVGLEP